MSRNRIRLALQSSGRLSEGSLQLLSQVGIRFQKSKQRLYSSADNFPVDLYFVRDDDIPQYVADGVADIGIVGENVVLEKPGLVNISQRLGFSRCRLSIAVRRQDPYDGPETLAGKHIATSHPRILGDFLEKYDVDATVHTISGSVEIAPGIGMADAVCDLVSTGSTLLSNGLREVETILESEAVLVSTPSLDPELERLRDQLLFRVAAVQKASSHKYILLNVPNDQVERVSAILPGMKSPTVVPLKAEGWSSLHSVVNEDEFWEVVDRLKEAGAQGMLVVPIEKMVL